MNTNSHAMSKNTWKKQRLKHVYISTYPLAYSKVMHSTTIFNKLHSSSTSISLHDVQAQAVQTQTTEFYSLHFNH